LLSGITLQEKITTADDQDPLALLNDNESSREPNAHNKRLIKNLRGSLAHAYALLLEEFGSMKSLADYLRISAKQCQKRYDDAVELARYQRHLPLIPKRRKITTIFKPWRRFKIAGRKESSRGSGFELLVLDLPPISHSPL
jgi:hypothetical protein